MKHHPFIRLSDNSCEVCGKQQAEHSMHTVYEYAPQPLTPRERMTEFAATMSNLQDAPKLTSEVSKTASLRWQCNDGRVFLRTGEKRQVQPGDWHWCDGTAESPEEVTAETRPHVCAIWSLPEDQSLPEAPAAIEVPTDPIERLIQRVGFTEEAIQDGPVPLLARIDVLAKLYQAQALQRLSDHFAACNPDLPVPYACTFCRAGRHGECTGIGVPESTCHCAICEQAPPPAFANFVLHDFSGAKGAHYCTACGGGRLHPIHVPVCGTLYVPKG